MRLNSPNFGFLLGAASLVSIACGSVDSSAPDAGFDSDASSPVTVSVAIEIAGSGQGSAVVEINGTSSVCASPCEYLLELGTEVNLTFATDTASDTFLGWSAPCSSSSDCRFRAVSPTTVVGTVSKSGVVEEVRDLPLGFSEASVVLANGDIVESGPCSGPGTLGEAQIPDGLRHFCVARYARDTNEVVWGFVRREESDAAGVFSGTIVEIGNLVYVIGNLNASPRRAFLYALWTTTGERVFVNEFVANGNGFMEFADVAAAGPGRIAVVYWGNVSVSMNGPALPNPGGEMMIVWLANNGGVLGTAPSRNFRFAKRSVENDSEPVRMFSFFPSDSISRLVVYNTPGTGTTRFELVGVPGNAQLALAPNGDYVLAGQYAEATMIRRPFDPEGAELPTPSGDSSFDIFVALLSPMGQVKWVKTFGGVGTERIRDVTVNDQTILVTGYAVGIINQPPDLGGGPLPQFRTQDGFAAAYRLEDGAHKWSTTWGDQSTIGSSSSIGVRAQLRGGRPHIFGFVNLFRLLGVDLTHNFMMVLSP